MTMMMIRVYSGVETILSNPLLQFIIVLDFFFIIIIKLYQGSSFWSKKKQRYLTKRCFS